MGRNDLCWCGSGKKYKKCHLGREKQDPPKLWEASKDIRKAFTTRYCLAPQPLKLSCSREIVKAHTVPKSGSLNQIARNGHVYSFIFSLENIDKYNGIVPPELVGINKASTFTGFCSVHDNSIFAPIEDEAFSGSQEQCFLLGYRALTREVFTKKASASLENMRREVDRGKSADEQLRVQMLNRVFNAGVQAGLGDSQHYKEIYDNVLISNAFEEVRAYVVELKCPPPVMCSAGLFPEEDFDGNELQDVADLSITPALINITSFYGGHYGAIVFTWLRESDAVCLPFVRSLMSLPFHRITNALVRLFFGFFENLHVKPDWWESLPQASKDVLVKRLADSADLEMPPRRGCLAEDGFHFDEWPIIGTKTIGF